MTTPAEQIYAFLRERWPSDLPGWLVLTSGLSRGDFHVRGSFELTEIGLRDLAVRAALWSERGENVWCTVNAFGAPPSGKGTAKQVRFVSGLVADVDVKNHPDPLSVIDGLPSELQPSTVVWSGGGAQPIWLFETPRDLDILSETTGQTIDQLQDSIKHLGQLLQAGLERVGGTSFDGVANLDRVMRLPYTTNVKYDPPEPVTICRPYAGRRFTGAAIQAALVASGITEPARGTTSTSSSPSADVGEAGQLSPAADRIEKMIEGAGDVPNGAQREYLLRLIGSMWSQGYAPSLIEREGTRVATELLRVYDPSRPWTIEDVRAMIADTARKFGQIDRYELTPEQAAWAAQFAQQQTADYLAQRPQPAGPATNGHAPTTIQDRIMNLPDAIRGQVIEELRRHDVRAVARSIRTAEEFKPPRGERLDRLLLYGAPDPEWTIDGLHERGTNMSLTAQFKTGKTSLQLNMLKCLVDDEPFLGRFDCRLEGNVAFFNYELTDAQFIRWAGRLEIAHPERVFVLNMRGLRLDLGDDYVRDWVTAWLREREIGFWFIDPLARAYYGDENDNTLLKQWTDHVDGIKRDAGVLDAQVSLHTGRGEQEEGNERARGATRIDDWVDGRMVLTRQGPNRFFRAEGREVEVEEVMLVFDPERHRLEISNLMPVNRSTARELSGQDKVIEALRSLGAISQATGVSKNRLAEQVRMTRATKLAVIDQLVRNGIIATAGGGTGNVTLHWLADHGAAVNVSDVMGAWAASAAEHEPSSGGANGHGGGASGSDDTSDISDTADITTQPTGETTEETIGYPPGFVPGESV